MLIYLALGMGLAVVPSRTGGAEAFAAAPDRTASAPARTQSEPRLAVLTRDFFVGAWETINIEFGQRVRIIWTLWDDGRLLYHFDTPGGLVRGSTGSWRLDGNVMHEDWHQPDGSRGAGRGSVEKIDESTIRLTIIDNGHPEYTGITRIYRRLGPPQLSLGNGSGTMTSN